MNQGIPKRLALNMACNQPGDLLTDRPGKMGVSKSEPTSRGGRRDPEYGMYFKDRPVRGVKEGGEYESEKRDKHLGLVLAEKRIR